MPIFWRYLVFRFLKIFFLIICSFIAILLVARFKEIARFITLGSEIQTIFLFALCQIPLILPLAIPISSLISGILLTHNLKHSNELTALRGSGLSLCSIILPLLFTACILSILNFYVCSELTTRSNSLARDLLLEKTGTNPLLLLNRQFLKQNPTYIDFEASSKADQINNLVFLTRGGHDKQLLLITGKELSFKKDLLIGSDFSLISYQPSKNPKGFDALFLENEQKIECLAKDISKFLKKSRWRFHPNFLPMSQFILLKQNSSIKHIDKLFMYELTRRFFLGLTVFSFTFLAVSYGLHLNKRNLLTVVVLSLLTLISFFISRQFKQTPIYALGIFASLHLFIYIMCVLKIRKISQGAS